MTRLYMHPAKILFPIDPEVDYRLPENREYAMLAWAESMYHTGELNQQLRLMDQALYDPEEQHNESQFWLAFLWACCYNFTGPWVILSRWPVPPRQDEMGDFADWYNSIFDDFRVDTDCRYRKSKMIAAVQSYVDWLDGRTQWDSLKDILLHEHPVEKYNKLWDTAMSWKYQGRLSVWNYVEAVALVTGWIYDIDCQDFMLDDLSGSESNRNGFCWVSGQEHLQTKNGIVKKTGEKMQAEVAEQLNKDAERVFQRLQKELTGLPEPVLRLNVETVFCWYKKLFRERQSRYLGWDAARTYEEIVYTEEKFPDVDCSKIWEARKIWLPDYLLCETKPLEYRGVDKEQMKIFINTGKLPWLLAWQQNKPFVTSESPVRVVENTSTARSLFD